MGYKEYLDEKLRMTGIEAATDEEKDLLVGYIAKAVIAPNSPLRQYVSNETIQSADGNAIVKELLDAAEKDPKVHDLVMDIEDLWDYDSEDIDNLKDELKVI